MYTIEHYANAKLYRCRQIVEQWVNWPCALMMVNVLLFDLVAAFFAARKIARWIKSRCLETKYFLVKIYIFRKMISSRGFGIKSGAKRREEEGGGEKGEVAEVGARRKEKVVGRGDAASVYWEEKKKREEEDKGGKILHA